MILVERPDGAVLRTLRSGTGPALLLVSGLGGTAGFWDAMAAHLPGHTLLRLDQRGIGGSTRGTAHLTIATLAQDCLAVLDAHGIESAVVLGHSMGGLIAQTLAAIAPARVQALVLSGTWHRPDDYLRTLFGVRLSLLESDPGAYTQLAALLSYPPEWLNAHPALLAPGPAGAAAARERTLALLAFDGAALPAPAMPVLVLGAQDDRVIPAHLQRELTQALPGSTLTLLDGGGHFYPVTRAAETAALVQDFLHQCR